MAMGLLSGLLILLFCGGCTAIVIDSGGTKYITVSPRMEQPNEGKASARLTYYYLQGEDHSLALPVTFQIGDKNKDGFIYYSPQALACLIAYEKLHSIYAKEDPPRILVSRDWCRHFRLPDERRGERFFPDNINGPAATATDLPPIMQHAKRVEVAVAVSHYQSNAVDFDYFVDGRKYAFTIAEDHKEFKYLWGHLETIVLIPPAVVADVMLSPVWITMGVVVIVKSMRWPEGTPGPIIY